LTTSRTLGLRDLRRAHAPFHEPPSLAVTGKAPRFVDAKDRAPNDFPNEYPSDAARAENVARRDAKAFRYFFRHDSSVSLLRVRRVDRFAFADHLGEARASDAHETLRREVRYRRGSRTENHGEPEPRVDEQRVGRV
jgi:hypothetical protein